MPAARGPGGRPPKYDPERMLPVVRAMSKLGATDVEIAKALKVSLTAVELWARTHPEFLRALKPPKAVADARVERSLYQRATGYSYDSEELTPYDHVEVKKDKEGNETVIVREKRIMRSPVVKHVHPDTTAAIFWLKNRRKHKWRDFKATELSTPPGRPFEVADTRGEAELIGAYYERLRRQQGPPKGSSPARSDTGPDPGVEPGGQGANGSRGGPKADKG